MKIGIFVEANLTKAGGVQEHVFGLAKALEKKGNEVFLIAPQKTKRKNTKTLGKRILIKPLAKLLGTALAIPFTYAKPSEIKTFLKEEGFDVIHWQAPFSFLGYQLLWQARKRKVVKVATFHIYSQNKSLWFLKILCLPLRRVVNCLDLRIAVSQAAKSLANYFFPGEYLIIPNAINVKRFKPGKKEEKDLILFVGRLDKRKGVLYLIKAFKEVKNQIPEARLRIIGKGPQEKQARKLVEENSLQGVEFLGYVKKSSLPRYYRLAQVCCFPAIGNESFGIVLLEAMASAKPVVAFDIDGYREVLTDELSQWLMPLKNTDALAGALIELLKKPRLRRKYGQLGWQQAQEYSWEKIGERILKAYQVL